MSNPSSSSATNPPVLPAPSTPDERTWCMAAHLSGIVGILLFGIAPLGPLIVYLIKKDQSPVIRAHAAEALNFQLTIFIAVIIGWVLVAILIGFLILAVAGVIGIVFAIIAAITVNKGATYRYPFALRLVN